VKFCECTKQNILDYPLFLLLFAHLLPIISPDSKEFSAHGMVTNVGSHVSMANQPEISASTLYTIVTSHHVTEGNENHCSLTW
jgi:hypothetical protein